MYACEKKRKKKKKGSDDSEFLAKMKRSCGTRGAQPAFVPRINQPFLRNQHANFLITVAYQQQTFITTDQSAFQRAGATGQYTITGQPSPLPPVAPQTVPSTTQRPLNGQFMDPAATATQSVGYERQDYVNGYQQQVQFEMNRF